jgi:gliding motility-associated-like protein
MRGTVTAAVILLSLVTLSLNAQVINNNGAVISVTQGAVVVSKDAQNTAGTIGNDGTVNLSGNFVNTATANGLGGTFRIGGNWTGTGGVFNPGTGTVIFNGTLNQVLSRTGGELFNNLWLENTGTGLTNRLNLSDNITVGGTLRLSTGIIDAGANVLLLSNPAASSLDYVSTTGSRIFGKFERRMNQQATYLFPLGTVSYYNPANITPNTVPVNGTLVSQFFTPGSIDTVGLPLADPPVEVASVYQDGYWSFTPNGFSSSDFNINLNASGFVNYPVWDVTRIIKRAAGGNWVLDGVHANGTGPVVYRNSLTGGFSPAGSEFALGRPRPLITFQPRDTIVCEGANPFFRIDASGADPLTYTWYKLPGTQIIPGPKYLVNNFGKLTILNAQLSDAGQYYCIVTDRYGNINRSVTVTLVVRKIPVIDATPTAQPHECSEVAIDNINIGLTYFDPGTVITWTRNNPFGISSSTIPMSGGFTDAGGIISGDFLNSSDTFKVVTFVFTAIGPDYSACTSTFTVSVTVNPRPRLIFSNLKPEICDTRNANAALNNTQISLTTPSVMTMGAVTFDYLVSVTGNPGDVTGDFTAKTGLGNGHVINFKYRNNTDTLQSVTYSVTPRNTSLTCPDGIVLAPAAKVHALPLPRLPVSIDITVPLTCDGGLGLGSLRGLMSEGAAPYNILWKGPFGFTQSEVITDRNYTDVTNGAEGKYRLFATDNLGCFRSDSIQMVPIRAVGYLQAYLKPGGFHVTCIGDNDGSIRVAVNSGITPPYNYKVVLNGVDLFSGSFPSNLDLGNPLTYKDYSGLSAGTYTLVITDVNGCVSTRSVILRPPPPITRSMTKSVYAGGYNVTCLGYNDGWAQASNVTGGRGGYTYNWYTTDGSIPGPANGLRIDNITAGTYYLLITDISGCTSLDSIKLINPPGISISSSELSLSPDGATNISCNNGNDGFIKISLTGGSGNYNVSWSGPGGFTSSSEDISGLKAGVYTATITDVANSLCLLMPLPVFTLTEPAPLTASYVKSLSADGNFNINCTGGTGSVDLTVAGGSIGKYRYLWSTTNGSGIVQGQQDQGALTAGSYQVTVTDTNHCVVTQNILMTEPGQISLSLVPVHITCQSAGFNNGYVDLSVAGGVAPYSYNWSNGASTQDLSGLTEGWYRVTVTDFNGCQKTDSVRVNLPPPLTFASTLSQYNGFNISCFGLTNGSVDITLTSGEEPFIYSWTGPDGFTSSSEDISGLKAGQYTLIVTDKNMCTATQIFDLTEPGKLGINAAVSQSTVGNFSINCGGGKTGFINVAAVNNAGTVNYLWSDGFIGPSRTGLGAGTYQLVMLDQNGCAADSLFTLTEPDSIKIAFTVKQAFCTDSPDGEISVEITGGVVAGNYNILWSDFTNGTSITNILKGEYKIKVTDANNCVARDSVIMEPLNPTCLVIPKAFSPNGDNINDTWNIGMIDLYPDAEVKVFNRWSELVWKSERGYPRPWDGRSNGMNLPVDSYHYIIDLNNGSRLNVGTITIVK